MDKNRFDGFTRQLAKRENRRQALKTLFAGGAGTAAALMIGKETEAAKPGGSTACCPADHPALCGLTCTAVLTDPLNCGSCNHQCTSGQSCVNGSCGSPAITCKKTRDCPGGMNCINGVCTPPAQFCDSPSDCPATGNDCVIATCNNHACGTTSAGSGGACGNGGVCDGSGHCLQCLLPTDCPGTDTECGTRTCTSGTCGMADATVGTTCSINGVVCDGAGNCVECITPANCLGGVANATTTCENGHCGYTCNGGYTDCPNGVGCVDTDIDPDHCGSCDHACFIPNGHAKCANGACAIVGCLPGYADCDNNPANGCEIEVSSDPNNCGGCNIKCFFPNATAVCINGACGIGECNPGWAHCDPDGPVGCETQLGTNANCGRCGDQCRDGTTCMSGECG